jgi:hypothetical protein
MAQVLFTNLTEEQADELVSWFCNSGEQEFYDHCQMHNVRVTNLDARATYINGELRMDQDGNTLAVMQQFSDEDLEE